MSMIEARGDESGVIQLQEIHQEVNERKGFYLLFLLEGVQ